MNTTPTEAAGIIARQVEALIQGEPMPEPSSPDFRVLLTAMRCMLNASVTGPADRILALGVLSALSKRTKAEVHFTRLVGSAAQ